MIISLTVSIQLIYSHIFTNFQQYNIRYELQLSSIKKFTTHNKYPYIQMISQYIQLTQKKCNFCYEWFTVQKQTKQCLHICQLCLDKGLNSTAFKVITPSGNEIYQLLFIKNYGSIYGGKNIYGAQSAQQDKINSFQADNTHNYNNQILLDQIDQYRNKQLLASNQKWQKIAQKIQQNQISNSKKQIIEQIYESIIDNAKYSAEIIEQKLDKCQLIANFYDVGVQINPISSQIATNTNYQNDQKKLLKIVPQQININLSPTISTLNMKKANNRLSLQPNNKYSRIVQQAKKFLQNNTKKSDENDIPKSINNAIENDKKVIMAQQNSETRHQQHTNRSILKQKNQNLVPTYCHEKVQQSRPSYTNLNKNKLYCKKRTLTEIDESISPFKSLKSLSKTPKYSITPNKSFIKDKSTQKNSRLFCKSPARFNKKNPYTLQKQLASLKNDKLKYKILQYLGKNYDNIPQSLMLLYTLQIYDAVINTNTLNKCIEIISYSIQNIGQFFKCYLEMLDWDGIQVLKIVKSSLSDQQFNIILNLIQEKGNKIETLVVTANKLSQKSYIKLQRMKSQGFLSNLKNVYMSRNRLQPHKIQKYIRQGKKQNSKKFQLYI